MVGRVSITAVILIASFFITLRSTLREGAEYYKHVDEVMVSPVEWEGKAMQLHGFVTPGSISTRPGTLEYRFEIYNQASSVRASYTGVLPDTFSDGAEVVLKGHLNSDQIFEVSKNGVMAKCPSKYEAEKN